MVKVAGSLHTLAKVAGEIFKAFAIVCIVFTVLVAVFGEKVYVPGTVSLDLDYVKIHLAEEYQVVTGLMKVYTILGLIAGQVWIPLGCCVGEFLFGYLAAYGGRRSDLGRHDASQVLGLRRYLKRLPKEDLSRLLANDPEYFFNMAPYALAMGVINPFSRAFGRRMMDQCPYLVTRVHGKRSAEEWAELIADTANLIDSKFRKMEVEKWFKPQTRA
jgi:hypothetical protein